MTERELGFLGESYKDKKSQLIVIYGKRRVGKTELVKQFFKGIPHIYFLADKAPGKDQLHCSLVRLSGALRKIGTDVLADLKKKALSVEWGKKNRRREYYVLFGKKGFTEEMKRVAEKEGIILRGMEEMNI